MKTANILVLNGGGIRGVALIRQLIDFENIIGKKLHEHFDIISGTSTGGIVAVLLSLGFSTEDTLKLYTDHGDKIFKKKWWKLGIFKDKYDDTYFNDVIRQYVGSNKLSNCKTRIVVPAYDISNRRFKIFRSSDTSIDYQLFDVVRSTAAAPSYFKAWSLEGNMLVDGGMVANNPSMLAWIEALRLGYGRANIINFSTGTQEECLTTKYDNEGKVLIASPTVGILLSENDKMVEYNLKNIFDTLQTTAGIRLGSYVRCSSYLTTASATIDDASSENISKLIDDGEYSAKLNNSKMKTFYINTIRNAD